MSEAQQGEVTPLRCLRPYTGIKPTDQYIKGEIGGVNGRGSRQKPLKCVRDTEESRDRMHPPSHPIRSVDNKTGEKGWKNEYHRPRQLH